MRPEGCKEIAGVWLSDRVSQVDHGEAYVHPVELRIRPATRGWGCARCQRGACVIVRLPNGTERGACSRHIGDEMMPLLKECGAA